MFVHEREPDPNWQADLDRIAPRLDRVNWLKIHWFAGMPYEPVQRWAIWEMIPTLEYVDQAILEDLRGPSPRENGYWKEDPEIPKEMAWKTSTSGIPLRWHSNSLLSFDQWNLFRETNCFSQLVWIVQGDRGGHLYRLGQAEMGALANSGIENADTPIPGDLPYADYSPLVSSKLAARDKLRRWDMGAGWDERSGMGQTEAGLWVRRDRKAQEEEYNKKMLTWLEDQIETAFSDLSRVNLPQVSDYSGPGEVVDEDKIDEDFVTDTATTIEV